MLILLHGVFSQNSKPFSSYYACNFQKSLSLQYFSRSSSSNRLRRRLKRKKRKKREEDIIKNFNILSGIVSKQEIDQISRYIVSPVRVRWDIVSNISKSFDGTSSNVFSSATLVQICNPSVKFETLTILVSMNYIITLSHLTGLYLGIRSVSIDLTEFQINLPETYRDEFQLTNTSHEDGGVRSFNKWINRFRDCVAQLTRNVKLKCLIVLLTISI